MKRIFLAILAIGILAGISALAEEPPVRKGLPVPRTDKVCRNSASKKAALTATIAVRHTYECLVVSLEPVVVNKEYRVEVSCGRNRDFAYDVKVKFNKSANTCVAAKPTIAEPREDAGDDADGDDHISDGPKGVFHPGLPKNREHDE